MTIKIRCPHCKDKILNTLEAYARHIFKAHNDDLELCQWVSEELHKAGKLKLDGSQPRYKGRALNEIPPLRHKELPWYIQKQLEEQIAEGKLGKRRVT